MGKTSTNIIGSKFLPLALSFTSMSIAGNVGSYYRTRHSYSGNYNKNFIEAGYSPISSHKVFQNYGDFLNQSQGGFHFAKGRIVKELVILDATVQDKHVFIK